jgi:hypothetical protein
MSDKRASKKASDEPKDETPRQEGALLGGKVINAPATPNDGGYEKRVAVPAKTPVDKTAGTNASSAAFAFEQRVSQEQGTH